MQNVLATYIHQLLQFHSHFFGLERSGVCIALVFKVNIKMIATIEFERGMAHAGVLRVVIGKLCHW